MGIVKARARFVGNTNTQYENNQFHDIKIKQDGWSITVKLADADKDNNTSRVVYDNLDEFLNSWDICCRYNIKNG